MEFNEYPSNQSRNYEEFVNHKLGLFAESRQAYYTDDIRKLRFQKYQAKQRYFIETQKRFVNGLTLVMIDPRPPIKANSPMKGYRRPPHTEFIKSLKWNPDIDILFISEKWSTKLCSRCFNRVYVSVSPNRFVTCNNCVEANDVLPSPMEFRPNENTPLSNGATVSMHRDTNPCRNIAYKAKCFLDNVEWHPNFDA